LGSGGGDERVLVGGEVAPGEVAFLLSGSTAAQLLPTRLEGAADDDSPLGAPALELEADLGVLLETTRGVFARPCAGRGGCHR